MKHSITVLALLLATAWAFKSGIEPADKPDAYAKSNYKTETSLHANIPVSVEMFFAAIFVALMGSVPCLLVVFTDAKLTRAHKIESVCLIVWLITAIFLFTNVLEFNSGSGHWQGARSLTIVEAVYLLSQILTTVGYGDITPAHSVSQVWVAVNVVLALCLYGSLVMEVVELIAKRINRALGGEDEDETEEQHDSRIAEQAEHPLVDWKDKRTPEVDTSSLKKWSAFFVVMVFIGVLFWHYYPGEGKSWLQAIYFSVITLSTVGFGAITAVTPGGMVFGAFWMLLGVASLAGVIGNFVEVMVKIKAAERTNFDKDKLSFFRYVSMQAKSTTDLGGDLAMNEYEFLKFSVLLTGLATEEDIASIEQRFEALQPGQDGKLLYEQILQHEAPPGFEEHMRSNAI